MSRLLLGPILAVLLLCAPGAGAEDAAPAATAAGAVHPRLLHRPEDRVRMLAQLGCGAQGWDPSITGADRLARDLAGYAATDYERHLSPDYPWENMRAQLLQRAALLAWIAGRDFRRSSVRAAPTATGMETLVGVLRVGVSGLSMPDGRSGDRLRGPGKTDRWGRLLEASVALFDYAVAFDLIAAPEVRTAGLEPAVVDELYRKLADGVFHVFVEHMRSMRGGWLAEGRSGPMGNNWNSREFAGVGMACLAMRERLLAEPLGSQRRRDYEDGLDLVRRYSTIYLAGWAATGDDRGAYYYESPHYFRYWVDTFLPFAVAHQRLNPEAAAQWPALALGPDAPIARFSRAHACTVLPTHRDKDGRPRWSNPPWDDSWLYPDDTSVPMLMAAAWLDAGPEDRARFLDAARRAECGGHQLLTGHPVWAAYDAHQPRPLPGVEALPASGVAMLRTGSEAADLAVGVKNTGTPMDGKAGNPSLWGHTHPDNGQVTAYREAEPVLLDPGYGSEGYSNKRHCQWFCNWNRHNVLLVEEQPGYAAETRATVGDEGAFTLPAWSGTAAVQRISRRIEAADDLGLLRAVEMELPTHRRMVIVPDRGHLLVVDRLKEPRRIKLCWWGNGSVGGRDNPGAASGRPHAGDPGRRSTAVIDPVRREGVFFRGPALATRIQVAWPAAADLATAECEYGPWWYPVNLPTTGMHVASRDAVLCAVTLIDIAPLSAGKAPAFDRTITVETAADGALTAIRLAGAGEPCVYAFAADGGVTRRRP